MIAVDFFCGGGGLTRGLMNAGVKVVLGIDADEDCKRTFEVNNRPAKFLHADLATIGTKAIKAQVGSVDPRELLFAGCAPCQPFSQHRRGAARGPDGTLLGHFGRFVRTYKPGYIVVENVPGLSRVRGFSTYQRFKSLLDRAGYEWTDGVLDAKDFGVPQTRRRLILIATRLGSPTLPSPTHGQGLRPYETVWNAIHDLPPLGAGEIHAKVPNHRASALSEINFERLRRTPVDGGSRTDWGDELVLECHRDGYDGHSDVYGRMAWKKPAPTLTCRCHSISNGRYGHPSQHRAISLREAARLQTFDDNFVFFGKSKESLATQIGNAVPVTFAERLGEHILKLCGVRPPPASPTVGPKSKRVKSDSKC